MNEEVRTKLADAASRVDGVVVTPYFRQTTKAGQGIVRLDRMTRSANGFGYMVTYQVLVQLPSDVSAAEKWIETHIEDLIREISEQLIITNIQPMVQAETNAAVLVFEGNRGQE